MLSQAGPVVGYLGYGTPYLDVEPTSEGRVVGVRSDGLDLFDIDSRQMIDTIELDVQMPPTPNAAGPDGIGRRRFARRRRGRLDSRARRERPIELPAEQVVDGVISSVSVAPNGESVVVATFDGSVIGLTGDGTTLIQR